MRKKDSVLWKISSNKTHHVSYLFGTMHIKDNVAYTHLNRALEKMETCQMVACEYNLDEAAGRGMDGVFMLPDHKQLADYLGDKKFSKIKKIILKSFDLDISRLSRLLPMTITSVLTEKILSEDNAISLDQKIWNEGIERNMEMAGVETFEGQANIMKRIEIEYQIKMLKDMCRNIPSFRKKILSLTDMYKEQKIHQLYKVSKKSLGRYRDLLLFKRNKIMTDSITQMALHNNTFIAVGAAHLSGKKGLLFLLKKEGFKVTPC